MRPSCRWARRGRRFGSVAGALIFWGLLPAGCGGEVAVDRLELRPSFESWQSEIQPLFKDMGCSVPGACHGDGARGNVRIVGDPDAGELYADYLGLKAGLNLESPEQSPLLRRLLRGGPGANHFPPCFNNRESCAWRKVVAWIGDDGEGPGPEDIDCEPSEDVCRP